MSLMDLHVDSLVELTYSAGLKQLSILALGPGWVCADFSVAPQERPCVILGVHGRGVVSNLA